MPAASTATATNASPTLKTYKHYGGADTVTAALANSLAALGVVNPLTKKPYTEALLLGVGGGLGGGYWLWEICGGVWVVLGTRHMWQDEVQFIEPLLKRLGIPYEFIETGSKKAAEASLHEALAAGNPCLVWVDMASLPHRGLSPELKKHLTNTVGVAGFDGTNFLLDDRAGVPLPISPAELVDARSTQPYMKNRLMVLAKPSKPARAVDIEAAIIAGIQAGAEYMLHPPIKNFGLPAIEKWAQLVNHPKDKKGWPTALRGAKLYLGQRAAYEAIALTNTGGGALRREYARFLEEAGTSLKNPALKKCARRYDELAALWDSLAEAALPDHVKPFKQTKALLKKREELFLTKGRAAAKETAKLSAQLADLEQEMQAKYPWKVADAQEFLKAMQERLIQLHAAEEQALGAVLEAI